jgi:tetratricopeptide (TPR) repeat protein
MRVPVLRALLINQRLQSAPVAPPSDLVDEQGRSEAAIDCLRSALRAAPDYAGATFNLALLLQRSNKHAEAAEYWRRYLANGTQSEWAARARRSLKFCEMQMHLSAASVHRRAATSDLAPWYASTNRRGRRVIYPAVCSKWVTLLGNCGSG